MGNLQRIRLLPSTPVKPSAKADLSGGDLESNTGGVIAKFVVPGVL